MQSLSKGTNMSDFKSKLPDVHELGAMASKLFRGIKDSVNEVINEVIADYKQKRAVDEESSPITPASTADVKTKLRPEVRQPVEPTIKPEVKRPVEPRIKPETRVKANPVIILDSPLTQEEVAPIVLNEEGRQKGASGETIAPSPAPVKDENKK